MKLKIMQYNTYSCSNYKDAKVDLEGTAAAIAKFNPDIIGLNEIRDEGVSVEYDAQIRILSSILDFGYFYFAKAIDDNGPNPYGNGLMSKYPIIEAETIMIPDPEIRKYDGYYETRCVLKAKILVEGKILNVIVTHFGLNPDEAENAVKTVAENLESENCILMGDFNVTPEDKVLEPIRERLVDTAIFFEGERLSFPSYAPERKIDYILTTPDVNVLKADIPEIIASDHRPHTLEIEFLGEKIMSIPQPKQYIKDFEQLGLGLFVHWGLYSQMGQGEWIWCNNHIEKEEYIKLKDTFTAEDFDADSFVLTAKNAGFKYITLTTRHHEGFSLYDTCGLNEFDAPHSPAKRDLIREFVDACNKYGIVPFFYHTTLDWYDERFDGNFDEYLEYLRKSVEILCTRYGKIGGFWFDGNWSKPDADWKEDELYATIRKYQPEAMIINNTGLSARGKLGNSEIDAVTFENGQATPLNREGMSKYVSGEMCHTINDHWGIGYNDVNYKSTADLIKSLCKCRKVGANYLLNIGPEAQGKINPYQKELLGIVGKWMSIFGEAVYNGRPYESGSIGENFILKSEDGEHLYIFAFDIGIFGDENVVVGGKYKGSYAFGNVQDEIETIEWMDNGESLKFIQGEGMLCVNFTGCNYGTSFVVRVAKAKIKK